MRIIAGAWRGRRLVAPPGEAVRPTSDRARGAIFNILMHAPWAGRRVLEGARVVDAFAGTGAMGLEAMSRGAAHVTFIETARPALAALAANVTACGADGSSRVIAGDATSPPACDAPCGLVFLDPPYRLGLVLRALVALSGRGWIASGGLIVAELARDEALEDPAGFKRMDERAHGAARLIILRAH